MRAALALSLALVSCAASESSLDYTRGTEALDERRWDDAVVYLKKAVELDPGMSRNHNNLAAAYFELGRLQEGWPEVREAVNLDPRNESARLNFLRYFEAMKKQSDLQIGDSFDAVEWKLGSPDQRTNKDGVVWWRYGHAGLAFEDGHLSGIGMMGVR